MNTSSASPQHADVRKLPMSSPEVEARRAAACPLCGYGPSRSFLDAPDRFHWRTTRYLLVECPGCSCIWLANPPVPERMPLHYGDDYYRAIAASGESDAANRWLRPRRTIERYKRSGAILDVGCNTGAFLSTLDGWNCSGIEIDPAAAATARRRTGCEVFVGNAIDAPFSARSFDVITCFDVLEHVYEPRRLVLRIVEWLKPGGIFYLSLPNIASWEASLFRSYWYGLELPRHLFHWSPQSVRYLMNSAGLEEVWLTTHFCYAEESFAYLHSRALEAIGIAPVPRAAMRPKGIIWRMIRKGFRVAAFAPFAKIAAWAGAAAGLEAMFRKTVEPDAGPESALWEIEKAAV